MRGRWFRVYCEILDDPKINQLPARLFKILVRLWAVWAENDGREPQPDPIRIQSGSQPDPIQTETELKLEHNSFQSEMHLALRLHMKIETLRRALVELQAAGLIDNDDNGLRPHNWNLRQFKSDTSTGRVKRYRKRKRNVSETPPDNRVQNTDTEGSPLTPHNSKPVKRYNGSGHHAGKPASKSLTDVLGEMLDKVRNDPDDDYVGVLPQDRPH